MSDADSIHPQYSTLSVRLARTDDLPALLILYTHLNPGDALLAEGAAQAIWLQLLSLPDTSVLLGEIDGKAVATCTLVVTPNLTRGGRPYALIENVVTHAEFRKRGFGHAILTAAIDRAKTANCYKVVLTTGSKRESTLAFYEKAGFKRNTRTVFEIRD